MTPATPMRGQKRPRENDAKHLAFIRTLPCVRCGTDHNVQAAHIRYGSLAHGKRETGAGEKPSDKWTVPLCETDHVFGATAQHSRGERRWWAELGIDPLVLAALLSSASGDYDAGCNIIAYALQLQIMGGKG